MTRQIAAIILTLIVTLTPGAHAQPLPIEDTIDIQRTETLRVDNEVAQDVANQFLQDGYTRQALNHYRELATLIQDEVSLLHQLRTVATSHMANKTGEIQLLLSGIVAAVDDQLLVAHAQLADVHEAAQLIRVTAGIRR